ncbi:Nuclear speckle splicing regulatory protein 1 [Vanrija pseudolonga]|uniref:Nuclear speckle splicing regulatory protein 1 n=1 Tax=Vanrija pseudolonga TaxID=143232 RepID=A0AAF1BKY3_9TREE|nr:Nuclear speckle splicing regulatory protein 1 [Vanrija pseudolonga]
MSDGKISFSFGGNAGGSKPKAAAAPAAAPMSNMELLMAKAKSKQAAPAKKPVSAMFGGDDDDDDGPSRAPPNLLGGPSRKGAQGQPPRPPANLLSRSERRAQEEAKKIDAAVFDYDGVYEDMKAAERKLEDARKAEDAEKKPRFIESAIAAAQTRKLDRLRAEEKMLARERDAEGDEFADKETFVTEAYKKQMEEVRKAEEEEAEREAALKRSNKGPGLTSLYKSMLDEQAAKHEAAVSATQAKPATGPSLAIRPPTAKDDTFDDEEEFDPLLAREAKSSSASYKVGSSGINSATGKEMEINDEGEVVDKRSLLKAGLNIVKKPQAAIPNSLLTGQRSEKTNEPYVSRAVGAAAGYRDRMERERRRLADQVREEEEKKRAAAEARAREEEEAARRRKEGDDGEAERRRQEAKERFLARKRQREEDGEAGKKKHKE